MKLVKLLARLSLLKLSACEGPLEVLCNSRLYGQPDYATALTATNILPFTAQDQESQSQSAGLRIFGEPGFLWPRFSKLSAQGPFTMVQVPRLWRQGTVRIAVMCYADVMGKVGAPYFFSSWKVMHSAAAGLAHYCIKDMQSGGTWIVHDERQQPYMAVYLYERGSAFEEILNVYMNNGPGVNPYNPRLPRLDGAPSDQPLGDNVVVNATAIPVPSGAGMMVSGHPEMTSSSVQEES